MTEITCQSNKWLLHLWTEVTFALQCARWPPTCPLGSRRPWLVAVRWLTSQQLPREPPQGGGKVG